MELTVTNRVRAWPTSRGSGQDVTEMGRSKLACGEPFMVQTEHLRSKWHRATKLRDDHRWSSLKNRRCSFSCEPVKKGESVRRLKLIQNTINNHHQTMYVVLNIQSWKWLKQPLFLCYNKKWFIINFPVNWKSFFVYSKTKGFIYENIIRIRSWRNSFTKKWNSIFIYNKNDQPLNFFRPVFFLCNSPIIKYIEKSNRRS